MERPENIELGTMIRKEFKGNRMSITIIDKTQNESIQKLMQIMDKYHIKGDIVFHHYGRPSKCKREFEAWAEKYLTKKPSLMDKLKSADEILSAKQPIIKPGQTIVAKLQRADEILLGKTKM